MLSQFVFCINSWNAQILQTVIVKNLLTAQISQFIINSNMRLKFHIYTSYDFSLRKIIYWCGLTFIWTTLFPIDRYVLFTPVCLNSQERSSSSSSEGAPLKQCQVLFYSRACISLVETFCIQYPLHWGAVHYLLHYFWGKRNLYNRVYG